MAEVNVDGIPSAKKLLEGADKLPSVVIREAVQGIVEEGAALMKLYVAQSIRTEKSTGALGDSIEGRLSGNIDDQGKGSYLIEIGSPLEHAQFASRDIAPTTFNRVIFITTPTGETIGDAGDTGNFRFIGIRPLIMSHPFLENTLQDMLVDVLPTRLGQNFMVQSANIQRDSDDAAAREFMGSAMTSLFGGI